MDCIFCKIADGSLASDILYQDDTVLAFKDLNAQAPHHILIIPRKHITTTNDLVEEDQATMGRLMLTATTIAKQLNIAEDGYRLVVNCNGNGGQSVYHIHMHLLAGRQMTWPPG